MRVDKSHRYDSYVLIYLANIVVIVVSRLGLEVDIEIGLGLGFRFPSRIHILRGNHESRQITQGRDSVMVRVRVMIRDR
jgi:hypothetical protein